jgi:hypothetical protein
MEAFFASAALSVMVIKNLRLVSSVLIVRYRTWAAGFPRWTFAKFKKDPICIGAHHIQHPTH